MPLYILDHRLLVKEGKLATSNNCCCFVPPSCFRPKQWRIVEADVTVYAEGPVTSDGLLDNLPMPWVAYWYKKTDLSLKLEVEFDGDGWKTLEEWEETVVKCEGTWFADHTYEEGPLWLQPEPYNCKVRVGTVDEQEEGAEWWCNLIEQAQIIAGDLPCWGFGCWRGVPPLPEGVPVEDGAKKFDNPQECSDFCCPDPEPICEPCYLNKGTPYEIKIPPAGFYTFGGDIDGEWNNARNWYEEYDLAPSVGSLTLSEDVTTRSATEVRISGTLTISSGVSLGIEVTINGGFDTDGILHLVILQGEIAATGECEGGRGIVNGYVIAYGSGHVAGTINGAASFLGNSYTESGAVLAEDGDRPGVQLQPGVVNGYFVFAGNSTNKAGCDTSGTLGLSFAGNATNEAVVGNNVYWWENSRNAAGAVAGYGATFDGNSPDYQDWEYYFFTIGQGATPRTGGNYGTVGSNALFMHALDNYGTAGESTFDEADNETSGVVNGDASFENQSNNKGLVTGLGSFSDSSTNASGGIVNGDGDFESDSENFGRVKGNATFAEDGDFAFNSGTVDGDAEFFNSSENRTNGLVKGNAELRQSAINYGTVQSDATFHNSSKLDGGTVVGDATFLNTAQAIGGQITGTAAFSNQSNAGGPLGGTLSVTGSVEFNDQSSNKGVLNASASVTFAADAENTGTVSGNATFQDGAVNRGIVTGNATFTGTARNFATGTVQGNAVFQFGTENAGTVEGNATFTDSQNLATGIVEGDATFDGLSNNAGTVEGNATFVNGSTNNGTVTGDAQFTETSKNGGSGAVIGAASFANTAENNGTVNGTATFADSSANAGGTVIGYSEFSDSAENRGLVSDATFDDASINTAQGIVSANAEFNDTSTNNGSVYGDATFNGSSNNFGLVAGTKTCNTTGTC